MTLAVMAAPDAPFRLSTPIEHITELEDGTLLLHCVATSETPDDFSGFTRDGRRFDGEIIDYDGFKEAAPELMKWAQLKEMHRPETSAGTILELQFDDARRRVEADVHVVDPVAVKKVLTRTYKAVSIHGARLATRLEQVGSKTYRRVTRLLADELSLVGKPSNADAVIAKQFVLAKRAGESEMIDTPAAADAETVPAPPAENESDLVRPAPETSIDVTRDVLAKAADPEVDADAAGESPSEAMSEGEGEGDMAKAADEAAEAPETDVETAAEELAEAIGADELAVEEAAGADAATDDAGSEVAKAAAPAGAPEPSDQALLLARAFQEFLDSRPKVEVLVPATPVVEVSELAKAGARNAAPDQARLDAIIDLAIAAGGRPPEQRGGPAAEAEPPTAIAKAAVPAADPTPSIDLIRAALAPLVPTDTLSAIEARLAALDTRSQEQGEILAKVAKSPSAGGPANYAGVARGGAPAVTDRASALEAALPAIDDPRLREAVGSAAAFEAIKAQRGAIPG